MSQYSPIVYYYPSFPQYSLISWNSSSPNDGSFYILLVPLTPWYWYRLLEIYNKKPLSEGVLWRLTLFQLSLLPGSIDRDNSTHNNRILITQTMEIAILQVVTSDEDACNQNGKTSTPPSPLPQTIIITSIPY